MADSGGQSAGSGEQTRPNSLRKFMQDFHNKQHRAIETRVMLVCAFSVFAQFMFTNPVEGHWTTFSTLLFSVLCVLVTVFSTWLEYFPLRLTEVNYRSAEGQGLPLACLLLPTLATSCVHHLLIVNSNLTGFVFLYLCLLCQFSVAVILATLLHSIPYPNSVVFYNFMLPALSYLFQWWFGIPLSVSLSALVLFSVCTPVLLTVFPKSFTLCEAILIAQSVTVMLIDTALQVLHLYDLVTFPALSYHRPVPLLYVQFLLTGVFICCVLLSPLLHKVTGTQSVALRFWSVSFIFLSLGVGFMFILPTLSVLIDNHHPISFVFLYLSTSNTRIGLVVYWLLVVIATSTVVWAQSQKGHWLKFSQPGSVWLRKTFHLSALFVFLLGLVLDVDFLSFATSLMIFLFVVLELMRLSNMWPCGAQLRQLLKPMCDSKDAGPLVLSHIYLLLGLSLPLWICPRTASKLCLYSGVLALGVGDTMAALSGSLFGKLPWPGTTKTIEGTLMSVLSQLTVIAVLTVIDADLLYLSGREWLFVTGGVVATSLLEAYTWQIDNLILSLPLMAFFIAFLN